MAYLLGRFHTRRKLLNRAQGEGYFTIGTTILSVRVIGTTRHSRS